MHNFALIGAAGYVAERHMRAIRDTGNRLIAAYDKFDSVGKIDSYFPDTSFFTEQELFDRHNSRLKGTSEAIDWVSICTPNYLHDAHCRYGLRLGANVICEKPLCLNAHNIDALAEVEHESDHHTYNILQLRLHPSIARLHEQVAAADPNKHHHIDLTYITSRGKWYYASWKGDERKSGGIATNIGVHFYDMLLWIFGPLQQHTVHLHSFDRCAGLLELQRATVRYFLSIDSRTLPKEAIAAGRRTYRTLSIDGESFEFSDGFTDLHTRSYEEILAGRGFGLEEVRPAIELVQSIRQTIPVGLKGDYHPLAAIPQSSHPFGWLD